MSKFAIVTRGRSGSTAVKTELNGHPSIICHGELFHPQTPEKLERNLAADPPYYDAFKLRVGAGEDEPYTVYLEEVMARSHVLKPDAMVGFKLLYGQGQAHKPLRQILPKLGFKYLHLIRRNIVRQAISALVARQRGAYNAVDWQAPDERYELAPAIFTDLVQKLERATENNRALLAGQACLEIYYEDYCNDRESFLAGIFDFLEVERLQLPASNTAIMTDRNLRKVIANFEDIRGAAARLGIEDLLEAP